MAKERYRERSMPDGHLLGLHPAIVIVYPASQIPQRGPALCRRHVPLSPHAPGSQVMTKAPSESLFIDCRRVSSTISRAHTNPSDFSLVHLNSAPDLSPRARADNIAHTCPSTTHVASRNTWRSSTCSSLSLQNPGFVRTVPPPEHSAPTGHARQLVLVLEEDMRVYFPGSHIVH